jgi:hypothetical protein
MLRFRWMIIVPLVGSVALLAGSATAQTSAAMPTPTPTPAPARCSATV